MWISRKEYTALVDARARAETRADWLLTQVNLLNQQIGQKQFHDTGKPVAVPVFHREATVPPNDAPIDLFEDMGDVRARVEGVDWDDNGRVKFESPTPALA